MRIATFFSALRLRTLPLSLSGVILGTELAAADFRINPVTAVFVCLTACCLQIISNLSNELGDFLSETSSGQGRESSSALRDGTISERQMKIMIGAWVVFAVASGLVMIWLSFGTLFSLDSFVLMLLGYFSIKAAMKYTLGKSPYGYRGWGDLYVFIFFGMVSVLGAYFVLTHSFGTWILLLPAASIGAFSTAVLNVNNMRDSRTDIKSRTTLAIRLGERNSKIYHTILIASGWLCMIAYTSLRYFDIWHLLYFLTLPLYILHLVYVWKHSGKALDKALPMLVVSTFLFALLSGLGFLVFLFI